MLLPCTVGSFTRSMYNIMLLLLILYSKEIIRGIGSFLRCNAIITIIWLVGWPRTNYVGSGGRQITVLPFTRVVWATCICIYNMYTWYVRPVYYCMYYNTEENRTHVGVLNWLRGERVESYIVFLIVIHTNSKIVH